MSLMEAPPQVRWNYTYACNFSCTHCYSRAAWYPQELSTSAYLETADQLIGAGVFVVGLGGGESLMRPDCFQVVARLSGAGVRTVLTTNGWLLNDHTAGRLAEAGLGWLTVSLDHPDAAAHDAFRNRSGSYARALAAVRAGVRAHLDVFLSTVVTAANVPALSALVALASREGARGIAFLRFRPAGKGMLARARYQLRPEQEAQVRQELRWLAGESGLELAGDYGADDDGLTHDCGCGVRHITIRPNGDVSPCTFAEEVIGNLTRESLTALWCTSPRLHAWRARGGCAAAGDQPAPSNPGAPVAMQRPQVGAVSRPDVEGTRV